MGLFTSRSDILAKKLKVRTRQLETINKFGQLRNQCHSSQEFVDKSVTFMSQELASKFVAIVLRKDEGLIIAAATIPEAAQQHAELIKTLAQGTMTTGRNIVVNNTRMHPRLRAAKVACTLTAPLLFKNEYIGAVVVFRYKRLLFKDRSLHTIQILCEQLPPALDYVAAGENVTQRNKELKVIYEVDKIKEKYSKDTQMLLDALAEQIQKSTNAKAAFIFLTDHKTGTSKFGSAGNAAPHKVVLQEFADEAVSAGEMVEKNLNTFLRQTVCVPATIGDDHVVFGMANSQTEFTEEDKRILTAIAQQADNALFEDRERKNMREMFSRYVSSDILDIMLKDPEKAGRTDRHETSILFADIRGFTSMTEKIAPELVVAVLNEYFTVMTDIILKNKGTVDKFVGDEIMALFGAPVYFEDHTKRAVKTAVEMQHAFRQLQARWKQQGLPVLGLGVGIDSGNVIVGNIGGEKRVDYTAIGDHVNTAARLCGQAADAQVLITENAFDQVSKSVVAKELAPIQLKGKTLPVKVYNALSIR